MKGTIDRRLKQWRELIPLRPAVTLAVIAFVCSTLVVLLHQVTRQRIEEKRLQVVDRQLRAVLPAEHYNNDLLSDTIKVTHERLGAGEEQTIWRARLNGKPVAAVISATAPDGYGGPITLLVAIEANGDISGVRVITHRETPGLGDDIDIRKSDWIRGFDGYSLVSLSNAEWQVKKDGGHFEHFTGATITPRAVTNAVHSALLFFRQNQEVIFADAN